MWARVIELTLACWLAMSPFVFGHRSDETMLWVIDFGAAFAIAAAALVSFHERYRRAHLLHFATASALITIVLVTGDAPPVPALQNYVVVALLLMMFGVVPSNSTQPPEGWRELPAE